MVLTASRRFLLSQHLGHSSKSYLACSEFFHRQPVSFLTQEERAELLQYWLVSKQLIQLPMPRGRKNSQTHQWKVTWEEMSHSCESTPYNLIFGGEQWLLLPAGETHDADFSFHHEISSSQVSHIFTYLDSKPGLQTPKAQTSIFPLMFFLSYYNGYSIIL